MLNEIINGSKQQCLKKNLAKNINKNFYDGLGNI